MQLTKPGIKVLTETSKSVQAKVLFPVSLFSEYHFAQEDSARFRINLGILLVRTAAVPPRRVGGKSDWLAGAGQGLLEHLWHDIFADRLETDVQRLRHAVDAHVRREMGARPFSFLRAVWSLTPWVAGGAGSLEEDGVLTDCSIQTMVEDEPLDIDVHATEIPCNIIMKVGRGRRTEDGGKLQSHVPGGGRF